MKNSRTSHKDLADAGNITATESVRCKRVASDADVSSFVCDLSLTVRAFRLAAYPTSTWVLCLSFLAGAADSCCRGRCRLFPRSFAAVACSHAFGSCVMDDVRDGQGLAIARHFFGGPLKFQSLVPTCCSAQKFCVHQNARATPLGAPGRIEDDKCRHASVE